MQASNLTPERAEPNLTPMLDMVFQLITFFMLVLNFKAAEVDRSLSLPLVGSAAPTEEESQGDILVLNLQADGSLVVRGQKQTSVAGFLVSEASFIRVQRSLADGAPLPITLVVRADRSIPFDAFNKAINECKKNGFDRFDFTVMRKALQNNGG